MATVSDSGWPAAPASEKFYVLVCRDCGDGDLPMPFTSQAERGKWASEHTSGTGHRRWYVTEQTLETL